jgi:hypothetical protein
MKKRKLTLNDWGRIPTVKVVDKPRETLKTFTEAYNREEEAKRQEKLTAPFRKAQSELHAETREINRRVKAFYSLDLTEMGGFPIGSAVVDILAIGFGNFPTRHTLRDTREENDIYRAFRKELEAQGTLLSEDGYRRLGSWISVQVGKGDIEPSAELWQCGLDRLTDLSCFKSGESNYQDPAPQPKPVTQSKPGLDDLLRTTSAESRSGREILIAAVGREWSQDVCDMMLAWIESLKKNFDYDFPVDELAKKVGEYMVRWNFDPMAHKTYDQIRRAFVKLGYLPDNMLTESERLADLIENADLNNRDVRRDIGLRTRELTQR